MDFDLKSVSVLIGVASAIVGLAFKLMPRSSDRLKRDLELLKLAHDAKANHLPLQRHVDAQINEEYLREGLSLTRKFDIITGQVLFAAMISTFSFAIVGLVVAYGSFLLFSLTEQTTGLIAAGFAAFGLFGGILVGMTESQKAIAEARTEIEERERIAIEEDQEVLRKASANNNATPQPSGLPPAAADLNR
jgi:hypothetical protein